MRTPETDIFFIGFLNRLPRGLGVFVPVAAVVLMSLFAGLGFALSAVTDDPGDGRSRGDLGRQVLEGVVRAAPYPTLEITKGTDAFPDGHVMMLTRQGKRGATYAALTDGAHVRVQGIALTRGDLDLLQLADGRRAPEVLETAAPAPTGDVPLGRWRVTGEICDGKCLAGAMRPERGIAHKACANLCLIGEIPPVFAMTGSIEGARTMLMAGPDGGPMPVAMRDLRALTIRVEGTVIRRGDLLIFMAEPDTAEVL